MSTSRKKVKDPRAGLRRMALWWEFQKTPEARGITSIYQANLREGFNRWYAKKFPVEAAIEARERSGRLEELKSKLLGPNKN